MPTNPYETNDGDMKTLRILTGTALTDSDCRVALRENNGDFTRACHWLERTGILARIRLEQARKTLQDMGPYQQTLARAVGM